MNEPNDCSYGQNGASSCIGDPVDLTTGRLEYATTDIDLGHEFAFSRYFNDDLASTVVRELPRDYLDKSLSQIKDLLKHAEGSEREALQKVKKALEQTTRLMNKVGGKPQIR